MEKTLISVIVITYNHEKYIRQALQSIVSQSIFSKTEVLVGDDGSKDNTVSVVHEFAADFPNIYVINRTENIGASANIYDLFQRAKGKYIAVLEGDDYWIDNQKLQKQRDFIEKNNQYSACTHDCEIVDENDIPKHKKNIEWICSKKIFTCKDSKGFFLSGQMGTLFLKNIFAESKNDYSIIYKAHPMISDRTIQLILALRGEIYHIDEKMSAYRQIDSQEGQNATSVCFTQNSQSVVENYILTETLERYVIENFGCKKLSFEQTKKMFFTSAVWNYIRYPNQESKKNIKKILEGSRKKKILYWIFLPKGVLHKIIEKMK